MVMPAGRSGVGKMLVAGAVEIDSGKPRRARLKVIEALGKAEVAMSRQMFQEVLTLIARLQTPSAPAEVQKADRRANDGRGAPTWEQSRAFQRLGRVNWAVSAVFHGPEGGSILSRMPEGVIMTSQLPHCRRQPLRMRNGRK